MGSVLENGCHFSWRRHMQHRRVLFLNPDYHCSFVLGEEFQKRGWKPTILVPDGYPIGLLFRPSAVKFAVPLWLRRFAFGKLRGLLGYVRTIYFLIRAQVIICYSRPTQTRIDHWLAKRGAFGDGFCLQMECARRFGARIVYIPSGCRDGDLRANFEKLDGGRVCGSCGFADRCDDRDNLSNIQVVRRYSTIRINVDMYDATVYSAVTVPYKAIDLDLFRPDITVPPEWKLSNSKTLRILHATALKGRSWNQRNIKGTPFVIEAVQRLKDEGFPIELISPQGVPSPQMRFLQVQADIIVDQLIYGSWGSTTIEALALGKPTICYLRPAWKNYFLSCYPEYSDLPIINSSPETFYADLRRLLDNKQLREDLSKRSREFAELHFNAERSVSSILAALQSAERQSGKH
jgi:hypothetical protein